MARDKERETRSGKRKIAPVSEAPEQTAAARPMPPRTVRNPGPELLLVGAVARALKCSATTVRKLTAKGHLPCATRGPNGERLYRRSDLEALVGPAGVLAAMGGNRGSSVEGNITARVFAMLKAGASPVDICIELQLPAPKMDSLVEAYAALRSKHVAAKAETARCAKCCERAARFCGACSSTTREQLNGAEVEHLVDVTPVAQVV